MFVYRLCNEEEINTIIKTKDLTTIGKECYNKNNLNDHIYEKDKKYLHFFLKECHITYLDPKPDRYICTYDIPQKIILSRISTGYYRSHINLAKLESLVECAIETDLLSFNYLIRIERPTKYLLMKNYLEDTSKYKEIIYTPNDKIKIKKI